MKTTFNIYHSNPGAQQKIHGHPHLTQGPQPWNTWAVVSVLLVWILMAFGVRPSPEDEVRLNRAYLHRQHHVGIYLGSTFRPGPEPFTVGALYEYHLHPSFRTPFIGGDLLWLSTPAGWREVVVQAKAGMYLHEAFRVYGGAGTLIDHNKQHHALAGPGISYRMMFFGTAISADFQMLWNGNDRLRTFLGAQIYY